MYRPRIPVVDSPEAARNLRQPSAISIYKSYPGQTGETKKRGRLASLLYLLYLAVIAVSDVLT